MIRAGDTGYFFGLQKPRVHGANCHLRIAYIIVDGLGSIDVFHINYSLVPVISDLIRGISRQMGIDTWHSAH